MRTVGLIVRNPKKGSKDSKTGKAKVGGKNAEN